MADVLISVAALRLFHKTTLFTIFHSFSTYLYLSVFLSSPPPPPPPPPATKKGKASGTIKPKGKAGVKKSNVPSTAASPGPAANQSPNNEASQPESRNDEDEDVILETQKFE